jgi:hypothetical protein
VKDPFDNVWYLGTRIEATQSDTTDSGRITMATSKLFRIALQVSDLDQAAAFYAKLLDDPGRRIPRGSRHYFDCGPVILALVDVTSGAGLEPKPVPDYVYFAVSNLDQVYERAKELNCLASDDVHGAAAGEIVYGPGANFRSMPKIRGAMDSALSTRRRCLPGSRLRWTPTSRSAAVISMNFEYKGTRQRILVSSDH